MVRGGTSYRRELDRATLDAQTTGGPQALGWPPERVIVTVKRIARDAGLQPSSRTVLTKVHLTGVDSFLVDMVGWCIERYYNHTDGST